MADTQYGIHSPFVFEMYRKVLFATVGREVRIHMGEGLPEECAGMVDCARGRDRMYHQQGNAKYNVSIDMYDAGVLMMNHRLHPQHFVLK